MLDIPLNNAGCRQLAAKETMVICLQRFNKIGLDILRIVGEEDMLKTFGNEHMLRFMDYCVASWLFHNNAFKLALKKLTDQ